MMMHFSVRSEFVGVVVRHVNEGVLVLNPTVTNVIKQRVAVGCTSDKSKCGGRRFELRRMHPLFP